MADINATQAIRFEAGGILRIYDGASIDVTVINREKSTLVIRPGGYEPVTYQDRGVNQVPLEGDERESVLEFAAKLVKKHTNDLMDLSQTRGTGLFKMWSADISIPDYKGASTGTKATLSECYFPVPAEVVEGGARYDTVRIQLASNNPHITWAAY